MATTQKYLALPSAAWDSATTRIPKRLHRSFIISLFIGAFLIMLMVMLTSRRHHAPFTLPAIDYIVHGVPVTAGSLVQEPLYPLGPFPSSPMITPGRNDSSRNPWLAAVICSAFDAERRMMIRSTWMRLFHDVPMDARFVVSNPGPQWTEILQAENRTFGDLIVLDRLQEDDITANTIKTIELYKWLINNNQTYQFVSKMDTDLFLNARAFWDRYLVPRLDDDDISIVERTVIGQIYYSPPHDLAFPHGSMYTYTWDMVETLAALQEQHHLVMGEDMIMDALLLKAHKLVNLVSLTGAEKFDYDDSDSRGDGTAWARNGTHPYAAKHALYGPDVIAVHELKDRATYLKVADAFDADGIKAMPEARGERPLSFGQRWHDFWYPWGLSTRYASRIEAVPGVFWTRDTGNWVCDGVWIMGSDLPR